MGGSHSLEKFINGVARDIEDPETKMTVWKRLQLSDRRRKCADDKKELRGRADLRIAALGSGTDYTGFLDHLGIAILDLGLRRRRRAGYLSFDLRRFLLVHAFFRYGFVFGRAMAQTGGTTVMRLADAEILPFDFVNFADTSTEYMKELEKLLSDKQDEIRERNQELDEGVFKAKNDPRRPKVAPAREEVPPHLNFAPMQNSLEALTHSAERYQKALAQKQASLTDAQTEWLRGLNTQLMESERKLTNEDGLPRRSWYKHLLYAPGVYTGYGVKTVPGVREGIEQKKYSEADAEIVRVAKVLQDEAQLVDSAAQMLEK